MLKLILASGYYSIEYIDENISGVILAAIFPVYGLWEDVTMKKFATVIALTAGLMMTAPAQALSMLGQDPDPSVIVTAGNLEWVWAGPCAPEAPSCGVVQYHHDFVLPTEQDWLSSFADFSAIVDAFLNDAGAPICASAYFNTVWDHCDGGDLSAGFVWGLPASYGYGPEYTANGSAEGFLVRGERTPTPSVPEPGILALFGAGLAGVGIARRRRRS